MTEIDTDKIRGFVVARRKLGLVPDAELGPLCDALDEARDLIAGLEDEVACLKADLELANRDHE